ncbi:MAG TPA: SCP2 sterol-binding domain-containing protein [Bacillota bacterium]|nr:SCP2 sterol-binding domain-containing protein [Bacillota bacterium]
MGCFNCWTKMSGVCILQDDMPRLLAKIKESELLVWATPVHHFGMSARLQRIIERMLPVISPFPMIKGHRTTDPRKFSNGLPKMLLIANGGSPDRNDFNPLVKMFAQIFGRENLAAAILCSGGELLAIHELQSRFGEYMKAVYQAGHQIVEQGAVSKDVLEALEKPLMPTKLYVDFAKAHWHTDGIQFPAPRTADQVPPYTYQAASRWETIDETDPYSRVHDLVHKMVTIYRPYVARQLKAVIQFDITNEKPGQYYIEIREGNCFAFSGKHSNPQLTIHTPAVIWQDILEGKLDWMGALLKEEYWVEGDLTIMKALGRLFRFKPIPIKDLVMM